MGFLERAIKRGISEGIGKAVGDAVKKAVEPTATQFANKAAQHIDNAAQNTNRTVRSASSEFESAFSNLERAAQDYATKMSENIKICPSCEKATDAEKTFCPECGSRLPDTTVAQSAICTECGKQNSISTKFCSGCGAKLPCTVAAEEASRKRDEDVLVQWDEKLSLYPKWNCGGCNYNIEQYDTYVFSFSADFSGNDFAAKQAVDQYRKFLVANGFHQAGQYPCIEHLYKKTDGVCCHVDTEHCFDGDSDCPSIGFDRSEPYGGYDYVKPEPKKNIGLKDLFKF